MSQQLILSPLKKAISSLQIALEQPKNEFTRDATIQRFEYTFELCWKMLKRYISQETGNAIHNLKDLFREGARLELLENLEMWFEYHEARNLTSHTYNEETAEETYSAAQSFLKDAKILLSNLESKTSD